MKLLYLYVQEVGMLKDREFNFSSRCRITIVRPEKAPAYFLCKCSSPNNLNEKFFSVTNTCDRIGVSAIVGGNGSGKTSIARILHQVIDGDTGLHNFALAIEREDSIIDFYYQLVFREGGKDWFAGPACVCLDNSHFRLDTIRLDFKPEIKCDDPSVTIRQHRMFQWDGEGQDSMRVCDELQRKMRMVYYSPVYTTQHPEFFLRRKYFRDISTTAALRYATVDIVDEGAEGLPSSEASLYLAEANETIKALSAAALLRDYADELNGVEFPIPAGVQILCGERVIHPLVMLWKDHAYSFEHELKPILDEAFNAVHGQNPNVQQVGLVDLVKQTLEMDKRGMYLFADFVVCSFFLFVFSHCLPESRERRWTTLSKEVRGRLFGIAANLYYKVLLADGTVDNNQNPRSYFIDQLKNLSKLYSEDSVLCAACEVFVAIDKMEETNVGLRCSLSGTMVSTIFSVVKNHAKSRAYTPYLTFSLDPQLSSGEMSLLTLFGRLKADYDVLQSDKEPVKDELVFLDEVETTFHPELQRKIVWLVIWFYEKILVNVRPHLIFSTHSPILLSDIPRSNIVFLGKKGAPRSIDDEIVSNTFASNIFDLYKDAFFLNKGTMGAFAADKVDGLLEKLNPKRKDNEEEWEYRKRIMDAGNTVDEDDLKVARLIGDPFLSRYVWRRLEELSKDYDIPEDEMQGVTNGEKS